MAAARTQSSEHRTIVRNTIYPYLRMILVMCIILCTLLSHVSPDKSVVYIWLICGVSPVLGIMYNHHKIKGA